MMIMIEMVWFGLMNLSAKWLLIYIVFMSKSFVVVCSTTTPPLFIFDDGLWSLFPFQNEDFWFSVENKSGHENILISELCVCRRNWIVWKHGKNFQKMCFSRNIHSTHTHTLVVLSISKPWRWWATWKIWSQFIHFFVMKICLHCVHSGIFIHWPFMMMMKIVDCVWTSKDDTLT